MCTNVARTLGALAVGLLLALPQGCSHGSNEGGSETIVGGQHGVVVEHRENQGTSVTVGGHKGVDVQHEKGTGTDVSVGGSKGVNVEHSDTPATAPN